MKNASVAGCQIFPIPPLPEGNHLRGKCVTRVLMPRAPCQMISMMSTDFFQIRDFLPEHRACYKDDGRYRNYVNFPGKKVKASCFFT